MQNPKAGLSVGVASSQSSIPAGNRAGQVKLDTCSLACGEDTKDQLNQSLKLICQHSLLSVGNS